VKYIGNDHVSSVRTNVAEFIVNDVILTGQGEVAAQLINFFEVF